MGLVPLSAGISKSECVYVKGNDRIKLDMSVYIRGVNSQMTWQNRFAKIYFIGATVGRGLSTVEGA
jgi:hypothetical protein